MSGLTPHYIGEDLDMNKIDQLLTCMCSHKLKPNTTHQLGFGSRKLKHFIFNLTNKSCSNLFPSLKNYIHYVYVSPISNFSYCTYMFSMNIFHKS